MIKIISAVLIVIVSAASVYNSYIWIKQPETGLLYVKAVFSLPAIRLLSLLSGIGGLVSTPSKLVW